MVSWCYFAVRSSPAGSVVFCCVTDSKHREAKECFIDLFIVDNCTISVIVRNMGNISVWAEVAFISLCALNRDFVIFIKANSAVLEAFCVSGMTVITIPNMIWTSNGFFQEKLLFQFCKIVYRCPCAAVYNFLSFYIKQSWKSDFGLIA